MQTQLSQAHKWFKKNKWKAFPFQEKTWEHYLDGYSGLVNAPTGSGKTYSLVIPTLLEGLASKETKGLQMIWIAPIRALTKEIYGACTRAVEGLGLQWTVGIRSGDTSTSERSKQWKTPPQILITTPESLHVIMTKNNYSSFFSSLKTVVVDEWHELIGSKRGVQTELFISRCKGINPNVKIWGISATIGNMDEAFDVLLGMEKPVKTVFIKAEIEKNIEVKTLMPQKIESFPWAGHLGIRMLKEVVPVIRNSRTTLIFTNTRAQCEIWYQNLLEAEPDLAGQIAMHHGSISRELRDWVEDALYEARIKAVVCTSSLDLGVDFRPVESIVQIGSPKGVSRFVQRAGRSGHQPGATSKIYFVPTHSLELVEAAALKEAIELKTHESRIPYIRSFDVLAQYIMTLAVSEGLDPEKIYAEVIKTFCFSSITKQEWYQLIHYLEHGSQSLQAYDEYQKIGNDNGIYRASNRRVAQKHKLSIGTIMSDAMIQIKFVRGKRIGAVEEYFVSQLAPGDAFWFGGQALELVRVKGNEAQVKPARGDKKGKIPSYMGGRMSFSSEMSEVLRSKLYDYYRGEIRDEEMEKLVPLFDTQKKRSVLPSQDDFLIESFIDEDGHHIFLYPFEGRAVHEGIAALISSRIGREMPISFSIAMNDYGLELLSDRAINVEKWINHDIFSTTNLAQDIQTSLNAVELARRQFRDIAKISGLVFQGYPGKEKRDRYLQASTSMIFNVFREYEPENLLHQQAYEELMLFQLEEGRMRTALKRIQNQRLIYLRPEKISPFAFPIMVDRLRQKMSTERLKDRIERMKMEILK